MIIKEGTKLTITHTRKGTFKAIAITDFDTENQWWPVILDEGQLVMGQSGYGPIRVGWQEAEPIPCRGSLVSNCIITGNIYESPELDKLNEK